MLNSIYWHNNPPHFPFYNTSIPNHIYKSYPYLNPLILHIYFLLSINIYINQVTIEYLVPLIIGRTEWGYKKLDGNIIADPFFKE